MMQGDCGHKTWRHTCRETPNQASPPDWLLVFPCDGSIFRFVGFRPEGWSLNKLFDCLAIPMAPKRRAAS